MLGMHIMTIYYLYASACFELPAVVLFLICVGIGRLQH